MRLCKNRKQMRHGMVIALKYSTKVRHCYLYILTICTVFQFCHSCGPLKHTTIFCIIAYIEQWIIHRQSRSNAFTFYYLNYTNTDLKEVDMRENNTSGTLYYWYKKYGLVFIVLFLDGFVVVVVGFRFCCCCFVWWF